MNDRNSDALTREAAIALLRDDPDIRILQRVLEPAPRPVSPDAVGRITTVAVLDVETTGFDVVADEIIDFAVGMIQVDEKGRVVGIGRGGQQLRDPGRPIPPNITRLTGLTDADVAGRAIDTDKLAAFLDEADILLSHNCAFDAPFLEALVPSIRGRAWACSCRDFDWLAHGFDGAKLGHLLMQCGWFMPSAHRAKADVLALVQLLSHELADGSTVIGRTLDRARRVSWRIEATQAPYDSRHRLRSRGYRWDRPNSVWWTEVDEVQRDEEITWLRGNVLHEWRSPELREVTWLTRYR